MIGARGFLAATAHRARSRALWLVLAASGALMAPAAPCLAESLAPILQQQQEMLRDAAHSQQRIDALDDESRRLLEEYRGLQADLDNLQKYNAQMERMAAAQEARISDLRAQLGELEVTRRRILPLMVEMVDTLDRFVAADTPFLQHERELRLSGLRQLLDAPDNGLAEKYRRILEAYRIEADYAYNIEAYSAPFQEQGQTQTADYLRLGRTALYRLSLDRHRAALWDPVEDRWSPLPERYNGAIERAIQVARKRLPPELLVLPLRTAGETETP